MWEKIDMANKDIHPRVTFTGNVTVNGPMFDIHDNQHVHIVNSEKLTEDKAVLSKDVLGKAIKAVQRLFWGQSAYAVIFCAMRDVFEYTGVGKDFEDEMNELAGLYKFDYPCPPNTIASSFYNNDYLKLHVNKWESHQVKPRSVNLYKSFVNAVNQLTEGQ